jgi:hypothetical protein
MDNQKQNHGKKGNEKGRQVDSDKDQPNEVPGQPSQDRMPTKEPVPSFNEANGDQHLSKARPTKACEAPLRRLEPLPASGQMT